MLKQLKSLTQASLVYGVGHIITRLVTFLLLPYYSFHMNPAEYGEITLYFLFIAVTQTFFVYGLDIAYLRYFTLNSDAQEKKRITGTTMLTALVTSAAFTLIIILFSGSIGSLLIRTPIHPEIVSSMVAICAGVLFFDTLTTFPFLLLRGSHRPISFTLVKVVNVATNIALNIWFIGYLQMSVAGVLWANLISSALTFVILVPDLIRNIEWTVSWPLLGEMIRFGIPNVPTYLFVMVVELADRKILEAYRGLEEAGLYSAGYKLGMFMAVVTAAFRFAWQPFFLSHASEDNAPTLFARVLTYYLAVTMFLFLALTFFVTPILETKWPVIGYILDARYWSGLSIFPIILLAHIFDGVYANLMVGIYIKKKTHVLPLVTGASAFLTIVLNILLIPPYGMIAAAWITFFAFFLQAFLLWLFVRKFYPVPYEWTRMAKLSATCVVILGVGMLPYANVWWSRLLLVALFPVFLWILRFFDDREIFHLRKSLARG